MDAKDERIAFLEQQLTYAIHHLRTKDATEEACTKRLEAQYAQSFSTLRGGIEKRMQELKAMQLNLGGSAARYAFLREHLVRVRDLDITARGKNLDALLDSAIKRANPQPESNIRAVDNVHRVSPIS